VATGGVTVGAGAEGLALLPFEAQHDVADGEPSRRHLDGFVVGHVVVVAVFAVVAAAEAFLVDEFGVVDEFARVGVVGQGGHVRRPFIAFRRFRGGFRPGAGRPGGRGVGTRGGDGGGGRARVRSRTGGGGAGADEGGFGGGGDGGHVPGATHVGAV